MIRPLQVDIDDFLILKNLFFSSNYNIMNQKNTLGLSGFPRGGKGGNPTISITPVGMDGLVSFLHTYTRHFRRKYLTVETPFSKNRRGRLVRARTRVRRSSV